MPVVRKIAVKQRLSCCSKGAATDLLERSCCGLGAGEVKVLVNIESRAENSWLLAVSSL